jgi:hypothetical protein
MSPLVCVSAKDTGGEAAPYCFLKNEKKISRIYRTDVAQSSGWYGLLRCLRGAMPPLLPNARWR